MGLQTSSTLPKKPQVKLHPNAALTLRLYTHTMPQQGADLSFAEFGSTDLNGGVET